MQPENINLQPEHSRRVPEIPAFTPEGLESGLDVLPDSSAESEPSAAREREVVNSLMPSGGVVTSLPAPSLPEANEAPSLSTDSSLIEAADEDNIEKEWINRAKDLVNRTKDDPRARGDETSALKADYQEKRFNRKAGLSNEAS